ncbi:MAG: UpxY family transcription antiterminator [Nitrospiraceae bacterium]
MLIPEAKLFSESPVAPPDVGGYWEKSAICWYAIRTRSRHEKIVRSQLAGQNIENFLPTVKRWSQWKDRKKEIEFPLFAGYCFARFSLEDRLPVLQSTGVVSIIGSGGQQPEPIPDSEIESLRLLVNTCLPYDAHPYLKEGMPVEVISGPLQGLKGRLIRKAKLCRLVVSINLIQQAASVEIDASSVAPA